MSEQVPETQEETTGPVAATRVPLWRRIVKWLAIGAGAVVVLLLGVYFGLDTAPGHRFIASQLANYTTESGLNIRVGRIRGSIYGRMELRDLRVSDPKGAFVTAPVATIDWRPFAFLYNHVDVRSMTAPLITMARSPELKPGGDPNAPILPDIDIDIGSLKVDRLVLAPPVTGAQHILRIDGAAHIADRRAQLIANADALRGPGVAGGDKLRLTLDAQPDANKLAIALTLDSPADGVAAAMSGVKAPITARVGGKGDWTRWRGKGLATLGGQSLADLDLGADNGRFRIRGLTHPGLYLKGPVERLTQPGLMVDIDSTLDKRRADTRMTLTSDALAVGAKGLLDLGENRFGNLVVDARLLTPGAILPDLRGRDVIAHVTLDGPFATPTVDYQLSAAAIAFGATGAEGLTASGKATVDAKHILIPVNARARRITGLNPSVGGLLTNVAVNGDFGYSNGQLLSDNLKLKSDRIDATAIVVADLPKGRYTGALKGRVNNYAIDGIGIVNLDTDAKLVAKPNGGFGIIGRVVAKTARIFNSGVSSFLGGNAIVKSDVGYDPKGLVTFGNLKLAAPQFSIYRGGGSYDLNRGAIAFSADAYSKAYGPITARMTGTAAEPLIAIRASRPGVGVGLADLEATIRGKGGAYAVNAKGATNYGPFGANLLVRTAPALVIDINPGSTFAGIGIDGSVRQTPAGPFAGQVRFAGSGVTGRADLSAQGKLQRADIAARAYNATIPGATEFTIGRALVNASVVMEPKAPHIVADAQVANLRYGTTVLSAARAKVDYANGDGTAQAVLAGSSGVPFSAGINARLQPKLWLVAISGKANGVGFRTPQAARIEPVSGGYRLQPVRLDFDKGSARLAGSYGAKTTLQARLDSLDLSIANAFAPDMGIGGTATGSVDYVQNGSGVPDVDARLNIANFNRASSAVVSEPVDVAFLGRLTSAGGEARALVKRGATPVGRMVATVSPLGSGDGWVQKVMSAPLSGGIRYNGPAGVLFSFGGFAGQQLIGGLVVAADFHGTLGAPQLNGLARADNLTYINSTYGTKLTQMKLAGRFTSDRLEVTQLQARAGEGSLSASGTVGLSADSGFPVNVDVKLDNATLAKSDALGATATGALNFTNGPDGGLLKGNLTIPEARYEVVYQGQAEVQELQGVRRKTDVLKPHPAPKPPSKIALDLRISADNQLFVSGMGLESEWRLDMRVRGNTAAPEVSGQANVVRGTYSFAGKRFNLDRGVVTFRGGPLSDPDINISASTTTNGINAVLNITGTGQKPQIAFTSNPTLPQDEVLSRLLFGSSPQNLSATEAIQLAAALNSLRGGGGGLNPLGKLRSAAGIDRLRILGEDQASGRGTSLAAGKYITDNVYVEIIADAKGYTATQLEIALTKSLSLLSQTGSFGGSSASLRYQKDF